MTFVFHRQWSPTKRGIPRMRIFSLTDFFHPSPPPKKREQPRRKRNTEKKGWGREGEREKEIFQIKFSKPQRNITKINPKTRRKTFKNGWQQKTTKRKTSEGWGTILYFMVEEKQNISSRPPTSSASSKTAKHTKRVLSKQRRVAILFLGSDELCWPFYYKTY